MSIAYKKLTIDKRTNSNHNKKTEVILICSLSLKSVCVKCEKKPDAMILQAHKTEIRRSFQEASIYHIMLINAKLGDQIFIMAETEN